MGEVTVHVLVATAIYDHGVVGVYKSRESAIAAANEIWLRTDGHHAFRVDERVIGDTYEDVFDMTLFPDDRLAVGTARIVKGDR
jgi:hypothetical protein